MSDSGFRNHSIPHDILDELAARFIIPMREEERKDLVRVCFLVEQAHWFYQDFYVSKPEYKLSAGTIKEFTAHIFRHIPFLQPHQHRVEEIIDEWREYKLAVPTFGAIILNTSLDKVLLVQGFFGKGSWGFPKGKVNEDEAASVCAAREVLEETGFDISDLTSEEEYLEQVINDQTVRLYLVPGVAESTQFKTNTRCEIRDIRWFDLSSLPSSKSDLACKAKLGIAPSSFFMVIPFLRDLRHWVKLAGRGQQQQAGRTRRDSERARSTPQQPSKLSTGKKVHLGKEGKEGSGRKGSGRVENKLEKMLVKASQESGEARGVENKLEKMLIKASLESKEKMTGSDSSGAASKAPQPRPASGENKSSRKQLQYPESGGGGGAVQPDPGPAPARQTQPRLPDGFCPKAWQNFRLDHQQLLGLALGRS